MSGILVLRYNRTVAGICITVCALPLILSPVSNATIVPLEGFEPSHPFGYRNLNPARLPFRHKGNSATEIVSAAPPHIAILLIKLSMVRNESYERRCKHSADER